MRGVRAMNDGCVRAGGRSGGARARRDAHVGARDGRADAVVDDDAREEHARACVRVAFKMRFLCGGAGT